jgi:hypothetical protein
MKSTRRALIKSGLVLGATFGIALPVVAADSTTNIMYEFYDNLTSLKKEIRWGVRWWDFRFRDRAFVVCLEDFPSYGQSKQSVHAWQQNAKSEFFLVWSLRTVGIGPLDVIVDEATGIITVKSKARTDLKDDVVGIMHLAATTG